MTTQIETSDGDFDAPIVVSPGERSRTAALQTLLATGSRTLQDSIDLAGASVREELEDFAFQTKWAAASLFLGALAVALLTGAAVLFLRDLTESWTLALLLTGVLHAGGAVAVLAYGRDHGEKR